jgi:ADP-ribose pyrophosphatase YjhB (NUDIX family)
MCTQIPIEQSELIAPAVAAGFTFHHAERSYLMLNHWLSEEENRMPANATHQVGVGCVVIHEGKMLAVQEKNGPLRGTGIWKMPTGLSDAGEDICDTAVREVLEETGIETEFVSILSIRQSHTALFGKSDLFFICLLRPKTTTIQMQIAEIAACEWIDAEEFLTQKFFLKSPIFTLVNQHVRAAVEAVSRDPTWASIGSAGEGSAQTVFTTAAGASADAGAVGPVTPPVPSFVKSKLGNGVRPGQSVLFHMPLTPAAGDA